MRNRTQIGFSILELLVVVTIILIIASIAVPHYLSSRMAANEANAVGSMRAVTSALMVYTTTYPAHAPYRVGFVSGHPGAEKIGRAYV